MRRWTERKGSTPLTATEHKTSSCSSASNSAKELRSKKLGCNELSQRNFDFALDLITGNICEGRRDQQAISNARLVGRSLPRDRSSMRASLTNIISAASEAAHATINRAAANLNAKVKVQSPAGATVRPPGGIHCQSLIVVDRCLPTPTVVARSMSRRDVFPALCCGTFSTFHLHDKRPTLEVNGIARTCQYVEMRMTQSRRSPLLRGSRTGTSVRFRDASFRHAMEKLESGR